MLHLRLPKNLLAPGLFAIAAIFAGCAFVGNHQVTVDAISGPTPPGGPAYQLVDRDPLMVRDPVLHKRVYACVAAALETKGVFAAQPGARPDFFVEVDYGANRGAGMHRLLGAVTLTEHFLQLSARRPRVEGSKGKGEEIWNVRTSVYEDQVTLSALLPVLAAAAADYAGFDTLTEKTVKMADRSPTVLHVKSVAEAR